MIRTMASLRGRVLRARVTMGTTVRFYLWVLSSKGITGFVAGSHSVARGEERKGVRQLGLLSLLRHLPHMLWSVLVGHVCDLIS